MRDGGVNNAYSHLAPNIKKAKRQKTKSDRDKTFRGERGAAVRAIR